MAKTRKGYKHHDTPKKSDLKSAYKERATNRVYSPNGTHQTQRRLFVDKGVSKTAAYRILKQPSTRRLHNDPNRRETRGQKSKLDWRDLRACELII